MSPTPKFEFDLSLGWAKGIRFAFEDMAGSKKMDSSAMWTLNQVHGNDLHICSESDLEKSGPLADADGLILQGDLRNQAKPMFIKTADCCPLVFVDIEREAIALVHAGWRGLALGIHEMPFELSIFDPKSTWIWLGPSLNGSSFEVDEPMWSQFAKSCDNETYFKKTNDSSRRYFYPWRLLEDWAQQKSMQMFYNVEIDTFGTRSFASYRRFKSMNQDSNIQALRNITWLKSRPASF